jgi:hypothetical protein
MTSWRARLAPAHVIALSTILWGLALAAHEILPRTGYIASPARWWCAASEAMAAPHGLAGSDPTQGRPA